jgi:hypothetical protein
LGGVCGLPPKTPPKYTFYHGKSQRTIIPLKKVLVGFEAFLGVGFIPDPLFVN